MMRPRRAFTMLELLIVLCIILMLVGITLPIISRSRQYSLRTVCAANLRQVGIALQAYASQFDDIIPRYALYEDYVGPIWLEAVAAPLGAPKDFKWADLRRLKTLQCPSHPVEDIPSGYVLNCFAFENPERWRPSLAIQLSQIKRPSETILVTDAADKFGLSSFGGFDGIHFEPDHTLWHPKHLSGGEKPRMTEIRHVGTSNVLYADLHVAAVPKGEFKFTSFDDGIRGRTLR